MNEQFTGIRDWINQTSMTSLSGLVLQIVWFFGSFLLTIACFNLFMSDPSDYFAKVPMAADASKLQDFMPVYLERANNWVDNAHQAGLFLAGILVAAWTGIKTVNTVQHAKDRSSSKELIMAQGEADAIRAGAGNGYITKDRPAMVVQAEHASVKQEVKNGDARTGE